MLRGSEASERAPFLPLCLFTTAARARSARETCNSKLGCPEVWAAKVHADLVGRSYREGIENSYIDVVNAMAEKAP